MNKKLIICLVLLVASLSEATARRRKGYKTHKTSLYRSLETEPEPEITTTEEEVEVPKIPTKAKLIFIKPRNSEANEGRFLKHILLYKAFMQPQQKYADYSMPYLIINTPTNLTNINNNTLTNAETATTTTTAAPTTAATTAAPVVRIAYMRDPQSTIPYALPMKMPTPVYEQRQQEVPQVIYEIPLNEILQNNRIRQRYEVDYEDNGNQYNYNNADRKRTNPFTNLANSLRRVQFL